jgi:palmitoyl-protein thioesterase
MSFIYLNKRIILTKLYMIVKYVFLFIILHLSLCSYPVVVFHGLSDNCGGWMENLAKTFAVDLNVYSKCIETGPDSMTWYASIKWQAERACEEINKDVNFHGDFSVVGVSQGAMIGRYIIEHCEMPGRVKRYVSIGGPQMGVSQVLICPDKWYCDVVNTAALFVVYNKWVQGILGPAGYVRDVKNIPKYLKSSNFLADLNNEKEEKNKEYKERFLMLEKIVLIQFGLDEMIYPKESEWFQSIDCKGNLKKLEDTEFYNEDFIGFRQLKEDGKVQFILIPRQHVKFTDKDVEEYMIPALR